MITPDFNRFAELARKGNLVPVSRELMADLDTPVSAFLKVAGAADCAFLLESAESEKNIGRYSFVGLDPLWVFEARGSRSTLIENGREAECPQNADPTRAFEAVLARYRLAAPPDVDLPFKGGAVGTIGYGCVRFFEPVPQALPDALGYPDVQMMMPGTVLVFDHFNHRLRVVRFVPVGPGADLPGLYGTAQARIGELVERLSRPLPAAQLQPFSSAAEPPFTSNVTREQFMDNVRRAREYIGAGDVFQIVLSQRLEVELDTPPFDVYRALRTVNPSPYMYYLRFGGHHVVGSSPEVFVRCAPGGKVTIRPIAGTRPRGADAAQDAVLEQGLLADVKERAEHVMLVDLARNDIGRVCRMGSVTVDTLMTIERYSHVMHIVSNVTGQLDEGKTAFDLMRACFPAGTVSGSPKVRAMQIIEELENTARGPYAGAVCYFTLDGGFNSAITIRTILVDGGRATIQAGAGLVYDSDPATEYEETLNKARAMLRALPLARAFSAARPRGEGEKP